MFQVWSSYCYEWYSLITFFRWGRFRLNQSTNSSCQKDFTKSYQQTKWTKHRTITRQKHKWVGSFGSNCSNSNGNDSFSRGKFQIYIFSIFSHSLSSVGSIVECTQGLNVRVKESRHIIYLFYAVSNKCCNWVANIMKRNFAITCEIVWLAQLVFTYIIYAIFECSPAKVIFLAESYRLLEVNCNMLFG